MFMAYAKKPKKTVYEIVTQRIIEKLEEGVIPWRKPWAGGMPISRLTGKAYSGVNLMLLRRSGEYMTFKQVQAEGGKVKKGSKAELVVFWTIRDREKTNKETGEKETDKSFILRYYNVFHIEDTEGIEPKIKTEFVNDPIEKAESIIKAYDVLPIKQGSRKAFYAPFEDYIQIPSIGQYEKPEEYYSTAFHECIHSTGHPKRLNRFKPGDNVFGSKNYSKEELVAEIGAAMLCGVAGIENVTIDNSAAYIKGWLSVLKDDSKLIVRAASQAQKGAELIQNPHKQPEAEKQAVEAEKPIKPGMPEAIPA